MLLHLLRTSNFARNSKNLKKLVKATRCEIRYRIFNITRINTLITIFVFPQFQNVCYFITRSSSVIEKKGMEIPPTMYYTEIYSYLRYGTFTANGLHIIMYVSINVKYRKFNSECLSHHRNEFYQRILQVVLSKYLKAK